MRMLLIVAGLAFVGTAQASTNFTYYASPVLAYQCTGFKTSVCYGFEASNSGHAVQSVTMKVDSTNPLHFVIKFTVDNISYTGNVDAANAGFPFLVWDNTGSGDTITVTVAYVKTRHCVKATCADRYLAESGSVVLP